MNNNIVLYKEVIFKGDKVIFDINLVMDVIYHIDHINYNMITELHINEMINKLICNNIYREAMSLLNYIGENKCKIIQCFYVKNNGFGDEIISIIFTKNNINVYTDIYDGDIVINSYYNNNILELTSGKNIEEVVIKINDILNKNI